MGVLHTIALVANTTSRIPFATGEWRGHFKIVGMYSRRIAYRDSWYMNKQVCILKLIFKYKPVYSHSTILCKRISSSIYQHSQKSPFFAGSWHFASSDAPWERQRMRQHPTCSLVSKLSGPWGGGRDCE